MQKTSIMTDLIFSRPYQYFEFSLNFSKFSAATQPQDYLICKLLMGCSVLQPTSLLEGLIKKVWFLASYDFRSKKYERYDQDVESSVTAVPLCTWSPRWAGHLRGCPGGEGPQRVQCGHLPQLCVWRQQWVQRHLLHLLRVHDQGEEAHKCL